MAEVKWAVLAGGGSWGASECGSLLGLQDRGEIVDYQGFSCVSVGGMNGAFLAQFPKTADGLEKLKELWFGLEGNKSLYKLDWRYVIPFLRYFWGGSLYHTKPQRKLIEKNFQPSALLSSGKKLRLGCVNDCSGEYVEATEKAESLVDWIMATSAFPEMFPAVEIDGMLYSDGGLRNIIPLQSALLEGATHIDVFLNGSLSSLPFVDTKELQKWSSRLKRRFDVMVSEIWKTDLSNCVALLEKFPNVQVRVFGHDLNFPYDPLDFSPKHVRAVIAQARARGPVAFKDFVSRFSIRSLL